MGKGLLFFCCACCILVLTTVNLSIGLIINGRMRELGTLNCQLLKDNYDTFKKATNSDITDEVKKSYQTRIDACVRLKGGHDMEYTAFIFDVVIGFVCGLIGLLHLFDVKKDFVSNTGLIGLCCGIVGFILTFVYVILSGIIFTNKYSGVFKRDSNGAYAERDGNTNKFKCLYYDDSGDVFSVYAKLSEINKKQYNYNKDLHKTYQSNEYNYNDGNGHGCRINYYSNSHGRWYCEEKCQEGEIDFGTFNPQYEVDGGLKNCKYLYYDEELGIENKDIFDRFLTTLILSLVVCLANIGLALFGFLLFRTPSDF